MAQGLAEQRLAAACFQPSLLRRSGFQQQVKPGVGRSRAAFRVLVILRTPQKQAKNDAQEILISFLPTAAADRLHRFYEFGATRHTYWSGVALGARDFPPSAERRCADI